MASKAWFAPTRLLDLESSRGICLNDKLGADSIRYIALSHCWGPHDPKRLVLLKENESELKEKIALTRLTTVFQEAVKLTRYLGLRFLWIDALCIIQDSKEDWAAEAARMASVYEYATLTLATAGSPDSHTSFLRPREKSSGVWLPGPNNASGQPEQLLLRPSIEYLTVMERHLQEPLQTRAWCLQERILSRRTIYFDTDQFLFECHQGTFPESCAGKHNLLAYNASGRDMLAYVKIEQVLSAETEYSQSSSVKMNKIVHWYRLLGEYCRRQLTYRTDALPAFSGVAKHLSVLTNDTYLAGIWQLDFHTGLLWQFQAQGTGTFERTEYAPSWSWASAWSPQGHLDPSVVMYKQYRRQSSDRDAMLHSAELDPLHNDRMSQLRSGILHISGLCRHVQLVLTERTGIRGRHQLRLSDPVCGLEASGWLDGDGDLNDLLEETHENEWSLTLTALFLSQWDVHYHSTTSMLHGLLLSPSHNARHVRRGIFRIDAPMMQGDELAEAQKFSRPPYKPSHFKFNPRKQNFDGTWEGWKMRTFLIE